MIFVDTGAWYASAIPDDDNQESASVWLDRNLEPLVTTDYIIDETLTLLKIRGYQDIASEMGELLFAGELAEIILVSEYDFNQPWQTFRQFRDKQWSFTDCVSKVIMEKLNIDRAFTFDHHFRQFGSVQVVP
jgi:predicted nucleic acid-binding protein